LTVYFIWRTIDVIQHPPAPPRREPLDFKQQADKKLNEEGLPA
jgi:hypothetical protein